MPIMQWNNIESEKGSIEYHELVIYNSVDSWSSVILESDSSHAKIYMYRLAMWLVFLFILDFFAFFCVSQMH